MTRPLVFLKNKHNLHSAAAVFCVAQGSPRYAAYRPQALKFQEVVAPAPGAPALPADTDAVFLFSFMTPFRRRVADEVQTLRDAFPRATLIAGGPHATGDPDDCFAMGFHHVVRGPAEPTLPGLLTALADHKPVPAVLEGTVDEELFNAYGGHAPDLNLFSPIEISRGCPCRCTFCMVPAIYGARMIHRRPEIVEAIARVAVANGRDRTWIVSSNALAYGSPDGRTSDPARLEDLLTRLKRAGLKEIFFGSFPSEVNPEMVTDENLAVLARHVANRMLTIGGQSGSPAVLARMRRPHTVEQIVRACETARRLGFIPHVDILFGTPGETAAERVETMRLVDAILGPGDGRIHFHYFMPLKGLKPWADATPAPLDEATLTFIGKIQNAGRGDGYFAEQIGFLERTRDE